MATAREKEKLLTADDLLRLYIEGVRGELIRGVLHETEASGEEHGDHSGRIRQAEAFGPAGRV